MLGRNKSVESGWIALGCIVVGLALIMAAWLMSCTVAHAMGKVEREHRRMITTSLKRHHIYREWRVDEQIHIGRGESGLSAGHWDGGFYNFHGDWVWWPHIRAGHDKAIAMWGSQRYGHRKVKPSQWWKCPACAHHRFTHCWIQRNVREKWAQTY